MLSASWCLFSLAMFLPNVASSNPWVDAGDEKTRHHLQTLVDSGLINSPITTWPIMWVNIKNSLDNIDPVTLSANQLWSYQYLKHELRRSMAPFSADKQLYLSNADTAIGDFSTDSREEIHAQFGINFTGDKTAFRLQTNYAHEPSDGHNSHLDGSFLSHLLGNWAVGVGAIDRWWGPGWESSLILSNNARPIPGIFLQRNRATPFELPVLKYLGPWQLTTFMSVMESNRGDHSHPRLWGMRVSLRPAQRFEIGLSRTAMWAGDGRPGDADTFLNLLIGRDNRGDDGATEENEPGNQLAGIDFRYNQPFGEGSLAIYSQLIGEDEATGAPSRYIGMAGAELQGMLRSIHYRISLEGQNTNTYFYDHDKRSEFRNYAYNHAIYSDGYRYRGRSVGAPVDNDTESFTVRINSHLPSGHSIGVALSYLRINYDESYSLTRGAQYAFSPEGVNTQKFELTYSLPISKHYAIKAGSFYYSEDLQFQGEEINLGGYLQLNARW